VNLMPSVTRPRPVTHRPATLVVLLMVLSGCAGPGLRDDVPRPEPSYAEPPAPSGALAEEASRITTLYGPEHSGFHLLDGSHEALTWRLALIDSAVSSLDILTYLWYPDVSGKLILERVILAAQRGVRVRLVVDDLLTAGQDQALANIQALPNVELRLFNPWKNRSLGSRAGEMIGQMERLNTRMHDKLLIADGHAAILGGRNIGDHYFGLSPQYNFHDLDVLAIGSLALDANAMFDHFWNSEWLGYAVQLTTSPDSAKAEDGMQRLQDDNRAAKELDSIARTPRDWTGELEDVRLALRLGTGYLVYDEVSTSAVDQDMLETMFDFFEQAEQELLITNAYIIPGEPGIEMLQRLSNRDVDIRILTNSLASHDVPAVNSHYEPWRKRLITAGAELYELRADAAIQQIVDVPPATGKFVGLHTKAAVVDGRHVFIGSMNLDPRSAIINTEMGTIINSPALAEDLRNVMLRDMRGDNAWHVTLSVDDKLSWTNDEETVSSQPSRNFLQNVMNVIFKVMPREQF
jgi:putative cardiolipin synthase